MVMSRLLRSLSAGVVLLFAGAVAVPSGASGDKDKTPPPSASVQGKVLFKGLPLPGGTITFHPDKGGAVIAPLHVDGTYTFKELPAGKYKVTIETETAKPDAKDAKDAKKDGAKYVPIPRQYADPKRTPLVVEVTKGVLNYDIQLTD
jgi:hypothetical protein